MTHLFHRFVFLPVWPMGGVVEQHIMAAAEPGATSGTRASF